MGRWAAAEKRVRAVYRHRGSATELLGMMFCLRAGRRGSRSQWRAGPGRPPPGRPEGTGGMRFGHWG